jgi:hypothetical protein
MVRRLVLVCALLNALTLLDAQEGGPSWDETVQFIQDELGAEPTTRSLELENGGHWVQWELQLQFNTGSMSCVVTGRDHALSPGADLQASDTGFPFSRIIDLRNATVRLSGHQPVYALSLGTDASQATLILSSRERAESLTQAFQHLIDLAKARKKLF